MLSTRTFQSLSIAILLCVIVGVSQAEESKPWVTITNCEYVASKNNDGDSFRVRSGTNEFTLRLYYVDAPETTLTYPERVHQQSDHYGITLDETLKAGTKAKERVQELLREPFIVVTRWASAAGRGRETRYYGLVEFGGKSLAEVLVERGAGADQGRCPEFAKRREGIGVYEEAGGFGAGGASEAARRVGDCAPRQERKGREMNRRLNPHLQFIFRPCEQERR